jgi:hypothetical protein
MKDLVHTVEAVESGLTEAGRACCHMGDFGIFVVLV